MYTVLESSRNGGSNDTKKSKFGDLSANGRFASEWLKYKVL
eukprot:SAG11_NODE_20344_length_447_cov_1.272989_1_plen_40_part_10